MVAAAALMIYLYQDHIHYLENKIYNLKAELELTIDCLDAHKEMVEDLEGYYEKWREAMDELSEAKNYIFELEQENGFLQKEKEGCEWEIENLQMQNDDLYRELEEYR